MAELQAPDPHRPEPLVDRDKLVTAITTFLAGQDPDVLDEIRDALERVIDEAGPDALVCLGDRLAGAVADWNYYPPDPLARRIHHVLADRMLKQDSALVGLEHVAAVADKPLVVFANHLSYSDANLLEILLHRAGGAALSDRLTVMAGPKVYSSLKRRFSSLCFGTIKTPQNSALSTEDAVMNARAVARAARRSIDIAHERLRLGEALLVFAEGTRSRTRGLQPMLAGVTRYLDGPDTWVLPVGIIGTEAMFPIGDEALHPVRIVARVGRPIAAGRLRERAQGDRRLMMDGVGLAIAELLPPEYRGAYADDVTDLGDARRLLRDLFDDGGSRSEQGT
jgi:1-acyl-sn-glycerol-3-phosphate acyltransferase